MFWEATPWEVSLLLRAAHSRLWAHQREVRLHAWLVAGWAAGAVWGDLVPYEDAVPPAEEDGAAAPQTDAQIQESLHATIMEAEAARQTRLALDAARKAMRDG